MNGELNMESEKGKGTSFRITIPLIVPGSTDPENPSRSQPNASVAGRNHLSILLAEDNPLNQAYVLRVLEKAGHTVEVAKNGNEAISAVKDRSFDLVLMDIQMPVVDGKQATQEIRKTKEFESLPIVALTANAMNDAKTRYLELGMNSVLSKPFKKEALLELVESLADGQNQIGLS